MNLYDATVPIFTKFLTNLEGWLDRALREVVAQDVLRVDRHLWPDPISPDLVAHEHRLAIHRATHRIPGLGRKRARAQVGVTAIGAHGCGVEKRLAIPHLGPHAAV